MLVFLALGWLAYVGFLLGALVLAGIIWVLCNLVLWIMDLKPRLTRPMPVVSMPAARKSSAIPRPKPTPIVAPVRERAEAKVTSDIWPKWTAARRQYMDRELFLWQEQFDALNAPK
ncbi:hypothetical protein [Arthrobacter sp. B6]|uniref:hypothetical protein n=1 Tax=Arthrobacter sp. B6 TaxID=1570137 RepID=UPI00082A2AC3|nr:hypothetical protein [Arthrobacter sp. B6]